MARPRSIKEVEYEILKYIMFNEYGNFKGLTDLFESLGGVCNDKGHLLKPENDKVKDKPLQKRIITARKVVKNVLGNMIDSRIKYLTEEHIDYGIENYKDIGE
jgi:hypothetical protein